MYDQVISYYDYGHRRRTHEIYIKSGYKRISDDDAFMLSV